MLRTGWPLTRVSFAVLLMLFVGLGVPSVAFAQDDEFAGDGEDGADGEGDEPDPELVAAKAKAEADKTKAKLGVGVRFRGVFLPESMLEIFLEEVPGGVSQPAFGLEVVRRKGNFDLVVGIDYHSLEASCPDEPEPCLYLEKGDDAPPGLDVAFVWSEPITDFFAIRYGAGLGLGIILGDVLQTDTTCLDGTTPSTIQGRCTPVTSGGQINEPNDDVPPVVPIVEFTVGGRFDVIENLSINVEAGFRDLFFTGISAHYFF